MAFWVANDTESWNRIFKEILWCTEFIYYYSMMVMLFLNLSLCHDLVQILKSPFSVARMRLNLYYAISFGMPFVIISYIIYTSD